MYLIHKGECRIFHTFLKRAILKWNRDKDFALNCSVRLYFICSIPKFVVRQVILIIRFVVIIKTIYMIDEACQSSCRFFQNTEVYFISMLSTKKQYFWDTFIVKNIRFIAFEVNPSVTVSTSYCFICVTRFYPQVPKGKSNRKTMYL